MAGVLIPKDKEFITLKANLNILLRNKENFLKIQVSQKANP